MQMDEKELKERRLSLTREIEEIGKQMQQAQQVMQQGPLRVAMLRGRITEIDELLKPKGGIKND